VSTSHNCIQALAKKKLLGYYSSEFPPEMPPGELDGDAHLPSLCGYTNTDSDVLEDIAIKVHIKRASLLKRQFVVNETSDFLLDEDTQLPDTFKHY
jgi:hypothetical protein